MKKELKMELLNSEDARTIKGGTTPCETLDVHGCPEKKYYNKPGGGCSLTQLNVSQCVNIEVKPCGTDQSIVIACEYPNTPK